MKIQERRFREQARARIHPYSRPSMSEENCDAPYMPRIEDHSLLYLAFGMQTRKPVVVDLVENNDNEGYEQEGAAGIIHVLAISLLLFMGRQILMILFMAFARGNVQDDGA